MGTICFAFQFMFCFLSGCLLFRQARWQAGDDREQEVVKPGRRRLQAVRADQ